MKMNILFVGLAGVPYKNRAADARLTAFANLLSQNHDVTILNRYSNNIRNKGVLYDAVKIVEIFERHFKLPEFVCFLNSVLLEPIKIWQLNRRRKIDIIHVYSGHFFDFIFYKIIAIFFGAKVVYQYVEFKSSLVRKWNIKGLYERVNSWLCDNCGAFFWDGCISISKFLCDRALEVNSSLKIIRIPPLCDFSFFRKLEKRKAERNYLLYCGSIGYLNVIKFIISAYNSSVISKNAELVLVLNGDRKKIEQFRVLFPNILVLNNLSYNELISYYKSALALLIPLRPIISDIARCPNKICEYLASEGLIVTTNVGEISYYFKDNENALIAGEYDEIKFKEKLDLLVLKNEFINRIRENSYQVGLKYFDIMAYKVPLNEFLNDLIFDK